MLDPLYPPDHRRYEQDLAQRSKNDYFQRLTEEELLQEDCGFAPTTNAGEGEPVRGTHFLDRMTADLRRRTLKQVMPTPIPIT